MQNFNFEMDQNKFYKYNSAINTIIFNYLINTLYSPKVIIKAELYRKCNLSLMKNETYIKFNY